MNTSTQGKAIRELVESFINSEITAAFFCDEFYSSYVLLKNELSLTQEEIAAFENIKAVSSRFSEFEEDHALDEKAFSSTEELLFTATKQKYW